MYGNGAGIGLETITMAKQEVAAIQRGPRRVSPASIVGVVIWVAVGMHVLFLIVTGTTLAYAAAALLVSGWCVPVLNKTTCYVKEPEYPIVINDN